MKERNIRLFYIHELLFQFSDSMLEIMLPVFIYKITGQISAAFLFLFLWNVVHQIAFIPVFNLAMQLKKPKFFMILGTLLYVTSLLLLGSITEDSLYLFIPCIFTYGLQVSCYWMIKHWFFAVNTDLEKMGKQMGNINIIRIVITFLAPIIAGFVSHFISFNVTFLLGAIAGTASLIPIVLFHAPPHHEKINFRKIINTMKRPEIKAIAPAFFSEGAAFVTLFTTWMITFTIFVGNALNLGLVIGLSTLLTAIAIRITGHLFDMRKRAMLITRLTKIRFLTLFLYPTVFFNANLIYVWLVETVNRLIFEMHYTTSCSYLYAYSHKINPAEIPLIREFYLNFGRLIFSLILAVIFYFLPGEYLWIVILLAPFTILGMSAYEKSDHLLHQK